MSCEISSQIHNAIKCSKYNEAIILTIVDACPDGNTQSGRREIVLIPSLDVENGGVIWNDACAASTAMVGQDIGISRHLRTKKWVMPMLNDKLRNKLYDKSIRQGCQNVAKKMVQKLISRHMNGEKSGNHQPLSIRVLDIGSGTGLLAMIASRHLKDILKESEFCENSIQISVKSIEMASAMARLASKSISENNLGGIIDVMEGHSCDQSFDPFYHSGGKAQLCTSELLESGLLGEGLIPAMRDAWNRHLEEDAIVIPQKARVYAQAIESHWITKFRTTNTHLKSLVLSPQAGGFEPLLNGNVSVPMHAEFLIKSKTSNVLEYNIGMAPCDEAPIECGRALCDPALVLEFDFTSKDCIPSEAGRSIRKQLIATESGIAHGILFWWEIDLYDETYSTKVGGNWQDHWQQCVYVFSAKESFLLKKEGSFDLITTHDDSSISFQIKTSIEKCTEIKLKRQKSSHETPRHISSETALQLNDEERINLLCDSICTALTIKGVDSNILDVSDFSLCSLIAAVEFNARNVTSIESSSNENIAMLSALVSQIGNNLPKDTCAFQILQAHLDSLNLSNLQQKEAFDVVMAEPYYEIMQSWNIASALNYHFIIKALKRRNLIKSDAISVPSYATIKCCAVEFHPDVIKAHCGLSTEDGSICGLGHSAVEQYGKNFSKYDMNFPLWQYKWKRLSEDITVTKLMFEGPLEDMNFIDDEKWNEIKFCRPGTCHCLAFWVDYGLRIQSDRTSVTPSDNYKMMTTGNRYHQQTIRMLTSPKVISEREIESSKLLIRPRFKKTQGNHEDDYSFEIKL